MAKKSVVRTSRTMSWVVVIYMVILFLELTVGCSLIVWKCTASGDEFECKLAIGGTITSIAIWFLVILVCPCYLTQCEICNILDNVIQKCFHNFGKMQARKPGTVFIQNEVYLPTTVSLLENRHDDSVSNGGDTAELLQMAETGDIVHVLELSGDGRVAADSTHNGSLTAIVAKQQEIKQFEHVSDSQDVPLLSGIEQGASYGQIYYGQQAESNTDHSSLMNYLRHDDTGD